jgi:hypothetical protein
MSAMLIATVLACAVPLPLREGQAEKDREIAMIKVPLPTAMEESLRGGAPPVQTLRFIDEPEPRREWVVGGNIVASDGSRQMLRLTPGETSSWQFGAEFGKAEQAVDGAFRFTSIAKGGCNLEASPDQPQEPVQ